MCTKFIPELNQRCTGLIDYDSGFNNLICSECGKKYNALDLEKQDSGIEIIKGGSINMKVILKKGNNTVKRNVGTNHIKRDPKKKEMNKITSNKMQVLFKGQERDTSQKLTQQVLSHDDIIKARNNIMNRQNNKKNDQDEVEVKMEIHNMDEANTNGRKYIKEQIDLENVNDETQKNLEEHVSKEINDTIDEQSASIEKGVVINDSQIENPGVIMDDNLTDMDRIEDKYGHLEEEFSGETYEKIFNSDTKKFY